MSHAASAAPPTPDAYGSSSTAAWSSPSYDEYALVQQQQQPMIVQSRSFEGSPVMGSFDCWTPLLDGMSGVQNAEHKLWGMQAVTAIENLNFEDGIFEAAYSSPSDSGSGLNAAAGSAAFASLPAWNSSNNQAATLAAAPRTAADTDEDETPDEAWLKASSGKSLRRQGRRVTVSSVTPMAGVAPLSPRGTVAAAAQATWQRPLRQALSAPELQPTRSSSSQLDDILEAMDCDSSAERPSTGGASPNAAASGSSSSTVSGSAVRGSLFQRRTQRPGAMPAPMPVTTTTTVMTGSLSSGPTYAQLPNEAYPGLQHSRSATFPMSSNNWTGLLLTQHAMSMTYTNRYAVPREDNEYDFVKPVQNPTARDKDKPLTPEEHTQLVRNTQAALNYGFMQNPTAIEQRQMLQEHQQHEQLPLINTAIHRRPSSAASLQSSNGLQTPVTPMQALGPAPMTLDACGGAWPSPIAADINFNSYGLPAPYTSSVGPYGNVARLSNSLGLSAVPLPAQRQLPTVDAASFAQVYGSAQAASAATAQQTQSLLQLQAQSAHMAQQQALAAARAAAASSSAAMYSPTKQRSSPNLRGANSPRKIASNRRVVSGEARPRRSTVGGGGVQTIPLPPVGRQRKKTVSADSAPAAFKVRPKGEIAFVNYGIEDADELCAAVAPSGSYKIPLRGYGSDEAADAAALAERAATAAARRMGPRWEERKEAPKTKSGSPEADAEDRSVKRRKSVASLAGSSPPGAKSPTLTATSGRKVNRKQSRATVAQ